MKKFSLLAVLFLAVFALAACGGEDEDDIDDTIILEDTEHNYYVTGNFAGWGDAFGVEDYEMEAIALGDQRIADLRDDLVEAEYIYIIEATFPDEDPEWGGSYTIDGTVTEFHGNQTVKFGKTTTADPDIPLFWFPSPESGEVFNLTPDTLFIPNYIDENSEDYDPDLGTGHWNDNPIVLETGTYHIVYAYVDGQHWVGAIPVE